MSASRRTAIAATAAIGALGPGCGSCGGPATEVSAGGASAPLSASAAWGPTVDPPRGGWVRVLAGAGSVRPVRVAADPVGGVVVAGSFAGTFDVGLGPVTAQPGSVAGRTDDAFLARFDGAGTAIFARALGDSSAQTGEAIAVDAAAGWVALAGAFAGRVVLGPTAQVVARGTSDGFVARFAPLGEPRALHAVAGPGVEAVRGIGADGADGLVVGGTYTGAGPFAAGGACPEGSLCGFVARLGSGGALRDAIVVRGASTTVALTPVVGPNGDVVFAGTVRGAVRFEAMGGAGGLDLTCGSDGSHAFVASAAREGAVRWARCVGEGAASEVSAAVAPDGTVYVASAEQALKDRDSTAARDDVRVAAFSATGAPRWTKLFGDGDRQTPHAVTVGPLGPIVAGGMFGTVDFGAGPMTSDDAVDAFVVELGASDGAHLASRRLGSGGSQEAYGLAVLPSGGLAVAGLFDGTLRAPTGGGADSPSDGGAASAVDAKSRFDVFVVVLAP